MAMTLNTNLEMGVAYPIPNYRFIYGEPVTLQGALANAKTQIYFKVDPNIPDIRNLITTLEDTGDLDLVDELLVGPSTNVNNSGAKELWKIKDTSQGSAVSSPGEIVNLNPLYQVKGLSYDYDITDKVSFISGKMPQKWTTSNAYGSGNNQMIVYPRSQNYTPESFYGESFLGDGGWWDAHALTFISASGSTDFTGVEPSLKMVVTETLLPSTKYRFGYGFRGFKDNSNPLLVVKVYDGSPWSIELRQSLFPTPNSAESPWYEYDSSGNALIPTTVTSSGNTDSSPGNNVFFEIVHTGTSQGQKNGLLAKFSHIFLEHARDTEGEDDGFYTFPCLPQAGSNSWDFRQVNINGVSLKKYVWNARFSNVPASFLKNLRIMEHYQDMGNSMFFHTKEMAGSNLPPTLKGRFVVTNITQTHWSNDIVNFNFKFIEE